jgi:hypothetical protein
MSLQRAQVLVDRAEMARFRRQGRREGMSLSAWLRDAGRRRLEEAAAERPWTTGDLDRFLAACHEREGDGTEPDWAQHRAVIEPSRRDGLPEP